ncbi:MAG: hypothetical protein IH621_13970 [Krumholzibacteria bacterium]|nr:hypothetical protein [Candidatus Krumholzibacteria bacterium]
MKKMLLCLLTAVLAAGLAGCVRMHSVTELKDDGSGTATLELGLSQSVADAIKEMQEIDPNSAGEMQMPDFADLDRKNIDTVAKQYNVKVTEFAKDTADGRMSLRMAFAFQDLKGLSAVMAAALGEDPEDGMGIYATADGNYVLKQAAYEYPDYPELDEKAEAAAPAEATEPTPEQMQKQMELMGKLMGAMAELDINLRITVPGDIIATNAPVQEGRTSIWTINSANMMTAGSDMDPVITFSGKGLKIKNALTE